MKIRLLLFFAFVLTINCFGQELIETKYYNKYWVTTSLEKFQTKREIYKVNDTLYQVKDYYKGKYLEMTGSYTSQYAVVENGTFIFYDKKGKILEEIDFLNGEPVNTYHRKGKKRKVAVDYSFKLEYYERPKLSLLKDTTQTSGDFQFPLFQGNSSDAFRIYIQKNLIYPRMAFRYHKSGTVYVSFIVNENGFVEDVKVVEFGNKSLEKEAARVIRNSPRWEPAYLNGKPDKIKFMFPVTFMLY